MPGAPRTALTFQLGSEHHFIIIGTCRNGPITVEPYRTQTVPLLRASILFRPHQQHILVSGMSPARDSPIDASQAVTVVPILSPSNRYIAVVKSIKPVVAIAIVMPMDALEDCNKTVKTIPATTMRMGKLASEAINVMTSSDDFKGTQASFINFSPKKINPRDRMVWPIFLMLF